MLDDFGPCNILGLLNKKRNLHSLISSYSYYTIELIGINKKGDLTPYMVHMNCIIWSKQMVQISTE